MLKKLIPLILLALLSTAAQIPALAHPHDAPSDSDHDPDGHDKDGSDDWHDADGKPNDGSADNPDG